MKRLIYEKDFFFSEFLYKNDNCGDFDDSDDGNIEDEVDDGGGEEEDGDNGNLDGCCWC